MAFDHSIWEANDGREMCSSFRGHNHLGASSDVSISYLIYTIVRTTVTRARAGFLPFGLFEMDSGKTIRRPKAVSMTANATLRECESAHQEKRATSAKSTGILGLERPNH